MFTNIIRKFSRMIEPRYADSIEVINNLTACMMNGTSARNDIHSWVACLYKIHVSDELPYWKKRHILKRGIDVYNEYLALHYPNERRWVFTECSSVYSVKHFIPTNHATFSVVDGCIKECRGDDIPLVSPAGSRKLYIDSPYVHMIGNDRKITGANVVKKLKSLSRMAGVKSILVNMYIENIEELIKVSGEYCAEIVINFDINYDVSKPQVRLTDEKKSLLLHESIFAEIFSVLKLSNTVTENI